MIILAADDEKLALEDLRENIKKAKPDAEIHCFNKPRELLSYAKEHSFDVAFLDIEMGTSNGLDVAKTLKKYNPKVNLIFVTGYSDYMQDAIKLRASGYLLKPSTVKDVKEELENLRNELKTDNCLFIRCFGDFDVFVDGRSITFEKAKTKELLAYLVDRRGSAVTSGELRAVLWEDAESDKNTNSYLSKLMKDLFTTLKKHNLENIIIRDWNTYALDTTKVKCDYYDYLDNKPEGIRAYNGEYMSQYPWAVSSV